MQAYNIRMKILTLLAILALAAPAAAQTHDHEHPAPEQLGRVHFETSCAPEVSAAFDRAVALLHSFSFSTAKRAFEDVIAADPACAMAHWGVAVTHWSNPFSLQRSAATLAGGHAAAARAMATGTPTPRERAYIAAVGELYKDYETVDQRTRVLAYERAMERLHRAWPDDREATAFYALAINQTALPTDKTYSQQLKAAGLLEELFADDPEHPGLAHYIIHAYDHPPLASRALEAARRYAVIAPSAPHALHMPSHTFTRVGYWQDSIETNIASAAAALGDGSISEALHAMDYQVYAYLQTAQDAAARGLVGEAPRVLAQLDPDAMGGAAPPVAGLYAAAAIPARYAMERGAWKEAAALEVQPTDFAYVDAITHFARAVGAARNGNPDAAKADAEALKALGGKLAAANETYWAEQVRIQGEVALAWIAFAEGRQQEALDRLRAAAAAEDAGDKSAISPGPLAPARELLGEMLLTMNRPQEALEEFEATLKKEPNRFRATHQAARAAMQAGNATAARKHYADLLTICKAGDTPGRPELREARKAAD
jgi:tetratricopeptide (TPR) repeat protein